MQVEDIYQVPEALGHAITASEITKRPLLIKGEPGTGKSLLAEYLAKTLGYDFFQWHIKSTTKASEGLYHYDALSRLNDARFAEGDERAKVKDISKYIKFGPLGMAFKNKKKTLILIDEIDKADIEFPNDLLLELDKKMFVVNETGEKVACENELFILITSNNEKELPDAFLRRCIFHYIDFPTQEFMKQIVNSHFPDIEKQLLENALKAFYSLRNSEVSKRPSTSELIDWLQILSTHGISEGLDKYPFLGALIKNEEDLKVLK